MAAIHRRGNGEAPLKQKILCKTDDNHAAIRIEDLILSSPLEPITYSKTVEIAEKRYKKRKGSCATKANKSRVAKYDVVKGIARTNAGVTIGRLVGGDLRETWGMIIRLLGGKKTKNFSAAMEENRRDRTAGIKSREATD